MYAIPIICKRSGFYAVRPLSKNRGVVYRTHQTIEASGLVDILRPLESVEADIELQRLGKSPYYVIKVKDFGETLMFSEDILKNYFQNLIEEEQQWHA